jgi:hypothetical protein
MGIMLRMRALPPGFIASCLPTKTDKLPSGDLWLLRKNGFTKVAAGFRLGEWIWHVTGRRPYLCFHFARSTFYEHRLWNRPSR